MELINISAFNRNTHQDSRNRSNFCNFFLIKYPKNLPTMETEILCAKKDRKKHKSKFLTSLYSILEVTPMKAFHKINIV